MGFFTFTIRLAYIQNDTLAWPLTTKLDQSLRAVTICLQISSFILQIYLLNHAGCNQCYVPANVLYEHLCQHSSEQHNSPSASLSNHLINQNNIHFTISKSFLREPQDPFILRCSSPPPTQSCCLLVVAL